MSKKILKKLEKPNLKTMFKGGPDSDFAKIFRLSTPVRDLLQGRHITLKQATKKAYDKRIECLPKEMRNTVSALPGYYKEVVLSDWGLVAILEEHVSLKRITDLIKEFEYSYKYDAAKLLKRAFKEYNINAMRKGMATFDQLIYIGEKELFEGHSLTAIQEGLVTVEDRLYIYSEVCWALFQHENGLKALRKGLITVDQLKSAKSEDSDALYSLLQEDNALEGLRKGIFKIEDVFGIEYGRSSNLRDLFQDQNYQEEPRFGFTLLTEKLITIKQACELDTNYLDTLCTEDGLTASREKTITPEQAGMLEDHYQLALVINEYGRTAVKEGLLSVEEVCELDKDAHIAHVFTKHGLNELRKGHRIEDLVLPSYVHRDYFSSVNGQAALENGVITIRQIRELTSDQVYTLKNIKFPNDVFSTTQEALAMPSYHHVKALMTKQGKLAISKGYLTMEDAKEIKHLPCFLTDNGLVAMGEELITVAQMKALNSLERGDVIGYLLTDSGLEALRGGLIEVEDILELDPYMLKDLFTENGLATVRYLINASKKQADSVDRPEFVEVDEEKELQKLKTSVVSDVNSNNTKVTGEKEGLEQASL